MVGWGRPADKENPSYTLSETKLHIFAQLVPGWLIQKNRWMLGILHVYSMCIWYATKPLWTPAFCYNCWAWNHCTLHPFRIEYHLGFFPCLMRPHPISELTFTQHPHASHMWQTLCSKTFPNTRSKSHAALPAVNTLTRNLTHAKIITQAVLNHTKTDLFNSLIPQCLIFRMVCKPNRHVELL